eukprot:3166060-Rhodomonas_salina.1
MARELVKATAAFSLNPADTLPTGAVVGEARLGVATGNWGCGVFGTDPRSFCGVRGSQGAIRSSSACCRSGSEVRAVLSAMLATLTEMAGGAVDGVLRRGAASHGLLRVQRQAGAVPPLVLHPEVLHTHVVARPSVLERRFSVFGLAVSGFAMRYAVLTAAVRLQGGADASGSQGDPGRGDDGSTPLLLLLRI